MSQILYRIVDTCLISSRVKVQVQPMTERRKQKIKKNLVSKFDKTKANHWPVPGNTKGGSITVPSTSYMTGLESAV